MLKKLLLAVCAISLLFCFSGCSEKKTVHCDNCNTEIEIDADSNMNEDWIIYCDPCNEEIFSGNTLLAGE